MKKHSDKDSPQIILRDGVPSAVIIDIEVYREMLERLDDVEDLKMLDEMKKGPLKFRTLDDVLTGS